MGYPVTPPPGVMSNGTEYSRKGRWIDSNLIRWVEGIARPVGGWERLLVDEVPGDPIAAFAFSRNSGLKVLVIGTTTGVYIFDGTLSEITPVGFVSPSLNGNTGFGWGAGLFGVGLHGTRRATSKLPLPSYKYFFDAWGEELIFHCNSDGKIYKLAAADSSGVRIPNSPAGCAGVIVTDERHILALGAGGEFNRIEWCDRENYSEWLPEITNLAGGLSLGSSCGLIDAVKWRGAVVAFTSSGLYQVRYLGAPLVYGATKITDCSAPVSPRCTVVTPRAIVWIGSGGITAYDGMLSAVPCPVWDFYALNVNSSVEAAVCGGHNSYSSEVWWFFPSGESRVPDRYMIWNYREDLWSVGYFGRSAWIDSGAFRHPIALTAEGTVLQHETFSLGRAFGIGSAEPYLLSAPMDVAGGADSVTITRLIPDEAADCSSLLKYTIIGRQAPGAQDVPFGPYSMVNGKIDTRATARQFKLRIVGPTDSDFGVGTVMAEIKRRGRR